VEIVPTELPGVLLVKPRVFGDKRGFFVESWSAKRYAEAGIPGPFVQDNLSGSQRGVLRGLHLQHPFGQGKLVGVISGEVFDIAVDVRRGSPTFGQWVGATLSGDNLHQIYIPPGFAHGFCTLRDDTLFSYKCTELYHAETELGIRWDDPDIGITWPVTAPVVSDRDARFPMLKDIAPDRLPSFEG
jgi:dTDP-4-dehydrorhamnose 3,5-epimerase